jgi:branched-chain amino acid transport system ATP-binding protein
VLEIKNLQAFYGKSQVLRDVSFNVAAGEIVTLLGRNGAGRSTTAKAIMGLVAAQGSVLWQGHNWVGRATHKIANAGLGYVPENRDVFPTLTVHQNLLLGYKRADMHRTDLLQTAYELFPLLKARQHVKAGVLSGGEQQLLSLARTLMGRPQLLIVDEPTEGLAPQMVALLANCFLQLKQRGVSLLLIEQKLNMALRVSDRLLVMGHGSIVFSGSAQALHESTTVRKEWLEV